MKKTSINSAGAAGSAAVRLALPKRPSLREMLAQIRAERARGIPPTPSMADVESEIIRRLTIGMERSLRQLTASGNAKKLEAKLKEAASEGLLRQKQGAKQAEIAARAGDAETLRAWMAHLEAPATDDPDNAALAESLWVMGLAIAVSESNSLDCFEAVAAKLGSDWSESIELSLKEFGSPGGKGVLSRIESLRLLSAAKKEGGEIQRAMGDAEMGAGGGDAAAPSAVARGAKRISRL